jgi:hypothetical protein
VSQQVNGNAKDCELTRVPVGLAAAEGFADGLGAVFRGRHVFGGLVAFGVEDDEAARAEAG